MAQRAIININGDLIPFSEDLDRIRTPGLGGSAVTWVPDADTICDQLRVTANGTYSAAEAGKYGYDYVVVSVPGSSVIGRDPDTGEEVEVHPDPETGEIVTTVLPTEIRVITPPAKTDYADGETVTKDGMVVKAYDSKGNEMQTVPVGEITINPTQAVYDASTYQPGGYITDGGENAEQFPSYAKQVNFPVESSGNVNTESYYWDQSFSGEYIFATSVGETGATLWACSLEPSTVTYKFKSHGGSGAETTSDLQVNTMATFNGETFYVNQIMAITGQPEFVYHGPKETTGDTTFIAYCILFGDTEEIPAGSLQTITVSWPRPGDGAVLETSFSINVTGGNT